MFKFFEGALGDILAPVSGTSNVLFLAIQHHKDDDVKNLMSSYDTDMARVNDNGYYPIHCSCRFNNVFALELIMSRGIQVDFLDRTGNTPLHYAAKYGHHDLCKILIGKGAYAGKKNNLGETAYDVSENHIVRQYLLPLQFQSERSLPCNGASGVPNPEMKSVDLAAVDEKLNYSGSCAYNSTSPIPSSSSAPPSSDSKSGQVSYTPNSAPPSYSTVSPPPMNSNWTQSPSGPPQQSFHRPPAPLSNNNRIILPDGFHTSASDPELQKKYGHTKNVIDIAPPPTFSSMSPGACSVPPQQYSMYTHQPGQSGSTPPPTINRYVAYDPYAAQMSVTATLSEQPAPQYCAPPPSAAPVIFTPPPAVLITSFQPPQHAPVSSSSAASPAPQEGSIPVPVPNGQGPVSPATGAASFFTVQVPQVMASAPAPAAPISTDELAAPSAADHFDSFTEAEEEVEILDANSSSVL